MMRAKAVTALADRLRLIRALMAWAPRSPSGRAWAAAPSLLAGLDLAEPVRHGQDRARRRVRDLAVDGVARRDCRPRRRATRPGRDSRHDRGGDQCAGQAERDDLVSSHGTPPLSVRTTQRPRWKHCGPSDY